MKTKKKRGRPTNAELAERKAAKKEVKSQKKKVKNDNKPFELVYHSSDKRFVVAAIERQIPEAITSVAPEGVTSLLSFGVAVTKRADLWSPADKHNPKLGATKALGMAKSQHPAGVVAITEEDKADLTKLFREKAESVGKRAVAEIEKRIAKDEQKYLFGKSIQEAVDFYEARRFPHGWIRRPFKK